MRVLVILLAIGALICALAYLRVRICVEYKYSFKVILKIAFLRIRLYPRKRRIRLSDYKLSKLKKKQKKKDDKKSEKKPTRQTAKKKKVSVSDTLRYIARLFEEVVKKLVSKLCRYLRVDVSEIFIRVASDDAAKTALLYGAVSQSVSYALAAMNSITNTALSRGGYVNVVPDFASEEAEVRINVCFSIRVWQLISIAISGAMDYIKMPKHG